MVAQIARPPRRRLLSSRCMPVQISLPIQVPVPSCDVETFIGLERPHFARKGDQSALCNSYKVGTSGFKAPLSCFLLLLPWCAFYNRCLGARFSNCCLIHFLLLLPCCVSCCHCLAVIFAASALVRFFLLWPSCAFCC